MPANKKLTILVSSTVRGYEYLLDPIYQLLTQFGYEVWMSHKGTMPVFSTRTAFENCLVATEKCDLFLGIILPQYGSGVEKGKISITHQELKKAVALKKPRWFLAHYNVVFARELLKNIGYKNAELRKKLTLKKSLILGDLRVIDMYEDAIVSQEKNLEDRQGNWVQEFNHTEDATLFAQAQFSRYQEVEAFLQENFRDSDHLSRVISRSEDRS